MPLCFRLLYYAAMLCHCAMPLCYATVLSHSPISITYVNILCQLSMPPYTNRQLQLDMPIPYTVVLCLYVMQSSYATVIFHYHKPLSYATVLCHRATPVHGVGVGWGQKAPIMLFSFDIRLCYVLVLFHSAKPGLLTLRTMTLSFCHSRVPLFFVS
jgi:hypothetical protein